MHGHIDFKKGILLYSFGGIQKKTREGIKLKSDIKILAYWEIQLL
jgi:DNA replicative helicase MCM subunit Mcm2 (Cdc46/Mcm family)